MKKTKNKMGRRGFLRRAAATAGAIAAPTVIPGSALGLDDTVAPSNRLVMGCIGVGGQGSSNMRNFLNQSEVQIVAVADVDRSRRDAASRTVIQKYRGDARRRGSAACDAYNDFREIVNRDDIDAVSIATPDHWHAITIMQSARAGKDMYAEKPLSLTIAQGREMSDTVARYGVLFQTGSQQRSDRRFRHACELVRNERIGKLHTVRVGLPTGPTCEPQAEEPIPEGFDYNFWLGPAPYAPYNSKRTHWDFRWNLDYSGGQLTDWAAHHCDIAQWGMGTEATGPIEVEGKGDYPRVGQWNAAVNYHFDCLYKNGVTMRVGNDERSGVTFEGSEGWVWVNRGAIEADPVSLLDVVIAPNEVNLYRSGSQHRNFLECVKSRQPPIAPIETAHRSISIAHLGNICMRLGRKLRWNPDIERFIDDPGADRMLSRAMRSPWHL